MKKMHLVILFVMSIFMFVGCVAEGEKEGVSNESVMVESDTKSEVYEFYVVDENVYCTTAEWEAFYQSIDTALSSKIERIWLNGWNNESGVQGLTVDDNVIHNSLCMLDKNAYIHNSYEDILLAFNNGEKVVLIGEALVTDEKTYKIGEEEYEIIGVFGKGPMEEHMQVPIEVYPNLETIDVFIIYFSEALTDSDLEFINSASENYFGGKISVK